MITIRHREEATSLWPELRKAEGLPVVADLAARRKWEDFLETILQKELKPAHYVELGCRLRKAAIEATGVEGQMLALQALDRIQCKISEAQVDLEANLKNLVDELLHEIVPFRSAPHSPPPAAHTTTAVTIDAFLLAEAKKQGGADVDLLHTLASIRNKLFKMATETHNRMFGEQCDAFAKAVVCEKSDLWSGALSDSASELFIATLCRIVAWHEASVGTATSSTATFDALQKECHNALTGDVPAVHFEALLKYWACQDRLWERLLNWFFGFTFEELTQDNSLPEMTSPRGDEVNILILGRRGSGKSSLAFALRELKEIEIQEHPATNGFKSECEAKDESIEKKAVIWRKSGPVSKEDDEVWRTNAETPLFGQNVIPPDALDPAARICFFDLPGEKLEELSGLRPLRDVVSTKHFIEKSDPLAVVLLLDGGEMGKNDWSGTEVLDKVLALLPKSNPARPVRIIANKADLRLCSVDATADADLLRDAIKALTTATPIVVSEASGENRARWKKCFQNPAAGSVLRADLYRVHDLYSKSGRVQLSYAICTPIDGSATEWGKEFGQAINKHLWRPFVESLTKATANSRNEFRKQAFINRWERAHKLVKNLEIATENVLSFRVATTITNKLATLGAGLFTGDPEQHLSMLNDAIGEVKKLRDQVIERAEKQIEATDHCVEMLEALLGIVGEPRKGEETLNKNATFLKAGEAGWFVCRDVLKYWQDHPKDRQCSPLDGVIWTFTPVADDMSEGLPAMEGGMIADPQNWNDPVSIKSFARMRVACAENAIATGGTWEYLALKRGSLDFRNWWARLSVDEKVNPLLWDDTNGCIVKWIKARGELLSYKEDLRVRLEKFKQVYAGVALRGFACHLREGGIDGWAFLKADPVEFQRNVVDMAEKLVLVIRTRHSDEQVQWMRKLLVDGPTDGQACADKLKRGSYLFKAFKDSTIWKDSKLAVSDIPQNDDCTNVDFTGSGVTPRANADLSPNGSVTQVLGRNKLVDASDAFLEALYAQRSAYYSLLYGGQSPQFSVPTVNQQNETDKRKRVRVWFEGLAKNFDSQSKNSGVAK